MYSMKIRLGDGEGRKKKILIEVKAVNLKWRIQQQAGTGRGAKFWSSRDQQANCSGFWEQNTDGLDDAKFKRTNNVCLCGKHVMIRLD